MKGSRSHKTKRLLEDLKGDADRLVNAAVPGASDVAGP